MKSKLLAHIGHAIVIATYGSEEDNQASDVTVECETCNEVLVSAEDYD